MSYPIICASLILGTIGFEILLFGWVFMKRNSWNWKILFILGVSLSNSLYIWFGKFLFNYDRSLDVIFISKRPEC